jgi:hypothetical protein
MKFETPSIYKFRNISIDVELVKERKRKKRKANTRAKKKKRRNPRRGRPRRLLPVSPVSPSFLCLLFSSPPFLSLLPT